MSYIGSPPAPNIAGVEATPTEVSDQANSSTGYFDLPAGTTAQRPNTPTTGMIRFNDDSDEFEGYDGSAWSSIGGGGNITTFGLFENAKLISANYTIGMNNNAISGGPIEIGTGVNVTVPSGSVWTVV